MEPYYSDDFATIYHGGNEDVLPSLGLFDLVVTSPPYNKGMRIDGRWEGRTTPTCKGSRFSGGYGAHADDMPMAEYEDWQQDVLAALWNHVSDRGAIFYNHKPRILNGELWTPLSLAGDLPLRQIITWNMGAGINWQPAAFVPAYEWLLLFAKPGFRLADGASARGDVWSMPPQRGIDHPAPFPVGLAARAIASAESCASVLDPFMGSGTTLIAAKAAGRRCVGIELEERHCDLAAKRLAQEVLDFEGVA